MNLTDQADTAKNELVKLISGCMAAERHISTLLAFLDSIESRTPGTLTETQRIVCQSIAREVGDMSFKGTVTFKGMK